MSGFGDLVARYVAAANSHDARSTTEFMAEDVEFEDVAMGEVLHGREAVRAFFEQAAATFSSDATVELIGSTGADSDLTIEWVMRGTHDGGTPTLPATNRPYAIRGVTLAHVVDDKFVTYRDYYDLAGFLAQVGLLPGA